MYTDRQTDLHIWSMRIIYSYIVRAKPQNTKERHLLTLWQSEKTKWKQKQKQNIVV